MPFQLPNTALHSAARSCCGFLVSLIPGIEVFHQVAAERVEEMRGEGEATSESEIEIISVILTCSPFFSTKEFLKERMVPMLKTSLTCRYFIS